MIEQHQTDCRHAIYRICILCMLALLSQNCDDAISDTGREAVRKAHVTLLADPNGLGDNGYNDDAVRGVFAFMEESEVAVQLLLPDDMAEAETMYRQWLAGNESTDSAVLIAGSTVYADMLKRSAPKLMGKGSRILLFETDDTIEGVSTLMVNRYGAAYLSGAMAKEFDVLIFAATSGVQPLEEAITGFRDGHGETGDGCRKLALQYLAEDEKGFTMPDSAYHVIYRRAELHDSYDEMIFPLLGGSGMGIVRYLNTNELTQALMIGMDVDQAGQSTRIPFSMIIRIGDAVKRCLYEWIAGKEWPASQRFGLAEGVTDVVITPNFADNLNIWDERYEDNGTFREIYKQYYEQAKDREVGYMRK